MMTFSWQKAKCRFRPALPYAYFCHKILGNFSLQQDLVRRCGKPNTCNNTRPNSLYYVVIIIINNRCLYKTHFPFMRSSFMVSFRFFFLLISSSLLANTHLRIGLTFHCTQCVLHHRFSFIPGLCISLIVNYLTYILVILTLLPRRKYKSNGNSQK